MKIRTYFSSSCVASGPKGHGGRCVCVVCCYCIGILYDEFVGREKSTYIRNWKSDDRDQYENAKSHLGKILIHLLCVGCEADVKTKKRLFFGHFVYIWQEVTTMSEQLCC